MFEEFIITEFLTSVASLLTSLGVIGGAFYQWVWKPYSAKKEEREEKWRNKMIEISEKQVNPITEEILILAENSKKHDETDKKLKEIAEQNIAIIKEIRKEFKEHNRQSDQRDKLIAQNTDLIKKHDERLDRHADRILVLETVSGLKPRAMVEDKKEEE